MGRVGRRGKHNQNILYKKVLNSKRRKETIFYEWSDLYNSGIPDYSLIITAQNNLKVELLGLFGGCSVSLKFKGKLDHKMVLILIAQKYLRV